MPFRECVHSESFMDKKSIGCASDGAPYDIISRADGRQFMRTKTSMA